MDLRIKNNNATKSYVITNNCTTRPRVCMKSDTGVPATPISYLPLTTSTTQGLALRAKVNDQSYRALEFRSMSGSATFYSSNANGQGLSSTTALTRASTSRTEYLTQSSTSRTEYLTRSSTSATSYLTRSSTSGESYLTQTAVGNVYFSHSNIGYARYSNDWVQEVSVRDYMEPLLSISTSSKSNWNFVPITVTVQKSSTTLSKLYGSVYSSSTFTYGYNFNSYFGLNNLNSASIWWGRTITGATTSFNTSNYTHRESYTTSDYDFRSSSAKYDTWVFSYNASTSTTGTSYLTRSSTYSTVYYTRSSTYDTVYYTRSSTYSTVYHTRSSTSGYSGVSSSSSETSGWQ